MNLNFKNFFTILSIFTLFCLNFTPLALAEEITITNNGNGSENSAQINSSTTTTITQNNDTQISNQVTTNATTGQNSASSNTNGDSTIKTGSVSSSIEIQNNANTSSVSNPCCQSPQNSSVNISGNGADSNNNASLFQNTQNTITVNQNATITNNIQGQATTGQNSASFNTGGNVLISTGSVRVNSTIDNSHINNSQITVPSGTNQIADISITGNGSGSDNNVNFSNNTNNRVNITNNTRLSNIINFLSITGKNKADFNTGGDVSILTGDIFMNNVIKNHDINSSSVAIICCQSNPPTSQTPPVVSPPNSGGPGGGKNPSSGGGSGGGGGGGSSSSGGGEVLGTSTGPIMPATGNNSLVGITLSLLSLFGIGLYLRIKSSQKSPTWVLPALENPIIYYNQLNVRFYPQTKQSNQLLYNLTFA